MPENFGAQVCQTGGQRELLQVRGLHVHCDPNALPFQLSRIILAEYKKGVKEGQSHAEAPKNMKKIPAEKPPRASAKGKAKAKPTKVKRKAREEPAPEVEAPKANE